jgi:hypothetical protein
MPDPRFLRVGSTIPDATFTGKDDDPLDDKPDTRPALQGMVSVEQYDDVYDRED